MTRTRHVTPSQTIQRLERLQALVLALQAGQLLRDEMGAILQVGPSGVRKYLVDLRGKVELGCVAGAQVCRWSAGAEETREYLASLAAQASARPAATPKSALTIAAMDPRRHIHIMPDDVEFKVRLQRGIPAHHPLLAHFYNLVPGGVWA